MIEMKLEKSVECKVTETVWRDWNEKMKAWYKKLERLWSK